MLCQKINKTLILPENRDWNLTETELQEYAVPIGLALKGLPKAKEQINFRQQEFAYPYPWKRYKKPLSAYMVLCCLAALFFFLFGESWIGFHEDHLKEEYGKTLQLMNKSYDTFEAEYEQKNPRGKNNKEMISLKKLSQQDLLDRFNMLEKELESTPDLFPLLPNIPRVSDVFAWLSMHPNVVQNDTEGKNQPLLQIENFNYAVVKRPELSKKNERYQAKVELEFSTSTPKFAREFHDALIAPNEFVDPKSEIKWSANRGKYRTSFFLKDKTMYPNASRG